MARYGALTLQIKALSNLANVGSTNTNIITAAGSQKLNRVGTGTFQVSVRENLTDIQPGAVAYLFINDDVPSADMDVATFIIEDVVTSTEPGGSIVTVSGPSLEDQLSYATLDDTAIDDGAGGVTTSDITDIMASAPAGWTLSVTGGGNGTAAGTYHAPRGDTVLETLINAASQSGEIFRLNVYSAPTKVINWRASSDSSGITLRMPAAPITYDASTTVGIILSLNEDSDFSEVVTRIRPFGAGMGDGRLDITTISVADPAGYTTTPASNLIVNDTLETSLGYEIKRDIDFSHISPDDITDATQVTTSKEALWAEGLGYLQERDSSKKFYRISCVVPYDLRPGQTVSVIYSEFEGGLTGGSAVININSSFTIHEVSNSVGADGIRKTNLLVGEGIRPKPEAQRSMAKAIQTARDTTRKTDVGSSPGSVPSTRNLVTSNPIKIAGANTADLSSDRTLSLGGLTTFGSANDVIGINSAGTDTEYKSITGGTGITINHTAGDVEIVGVSTPIAAQYVTLAVDATLTNERVLTAGDGIDLVDAGAGSTVTLDVDVTDLLGDGIIEATNNITLGTPATLTVATSDAVTTSSHTHAITTSSAVSTNTAIILATDSNGRFQVEGIGVGIAPAADGLLVNDGSTLNGGVTVNALDADVDFSVHDDAGDEAIFVDASSGNVGMGGVTTPSQTLDVDGRILADGVTEATYVNIAVNLDDVTADAVSDFMIRRSDAPRWVIRGQGAETGSESGTNLRIHAYTDAGALVAAAALTIERSSRNIGIGTQSPTSKVHIDQSSATGAIPVLKLDQADLSEEFINFVATIGTGNPIEAIAAKTLTTTHFVLVELTGGLRRYIPVGTIA